LGLNDAGVESVEVKGLLSLYGSDALGGVLYFNLRNSKCKYL
jgi:outer membrane receptor for ferrienterochelin and colicin